MCIYIPMISLFKNSNVLWVIHGKPTSLFCYIKDKYIPPPVIIPTREVKEVLLECEATCSPCAERPSACIIQTKPRLLVTIRYDMWISVKNKRCPNPDCIMCQNHVPIHNPDLERVVFYDHRYTYNVILLIGYLIAKNYTEKEVAKFFSKNTGMTCASPM